MYGPYVGRFVGSPSLCLIPTVYSWDERKDAYGFCPHPAPVLLPCYQLCSRCWFIDAQEPLPIILRLGTLSLVGSSNTGASSYCCNMGAAIPLVIYLTTRKLISADINRTIFPFADIDVSSSPFTSLIVVTVFTGLVLLCLDCRLASSSLLVLLRCL